MIWNYGKKKRRLQMVNQGLRATSKSSLKLQCLFCAKGDLKEAKELYDFFASDMPDLPDQDPIPLTWQQNTANTINGIVAWMKENGPTIQQAYQYVQQVIANRGVIPAPEPPAPTVDLPPINQSVSQ